MPIGTEGDDVLTNDTTKPAEVIDALGGDDLITVHAPFVPNHPGPTVDVHGGDGYDTLIVGADRIQGIRGEGTSGSLTIRQGGLNGSRPSVTWNSIERLEISATIFGDGFWTTGESEDLLILGGGGAVSFAKLSSGGGDDSIALRGSFATIDLFAGDGDDVIDLSLVTSVMNAGRNYARGDAGNDLLIGSVLADALYGGDGNDVLDGAAGADILYGGAGDDVYHVDNPADSVGEYVGEGVDEIRTALSSYGLQDFPHVENLTLLGEGTNSAAGNDGANRITGNSGTDIIFGRGGNDQIMAQLGGDDQLFGEAGRDTFYFGAVLSSADQIYGGTETDLVAIQGNYLGGNALRLGALADIEQLHVLSGADDSYGFGGSALLSYDITASEETLAPGQILYVLSQNLTAGEFHRFDGSAETNGGLFYFYGSQGTDQLIGGTGDDAFLFSGTGAMGPNDSINGGAGFDNLLLRGSYEPVFLSPTSITNIERIALLSGRDPNMGAVIEDVHYFFTLADANVPAGATLIVDASNLTTGEWVVLNGSGDSDGRLHMIGGAGNDTLIGGLGDDTIEGGLGADTLQDASGDTLYIYRSVADSLATFSDQVNGFNLGDRFDLSQIDADATTAEQDSFDFIGAAAFSGSAGELRAFRTSDVFLRIEADVDGDGVADFGINVIPDPQAFTFQPSDFVL